MNDSTITHLFHILGIPLNPISSSLDGVASLSNGKLELADIFILHLVIHPKNNEDM